MDPKSIANYYEKTRVLLSIGKQKDAEDALAKLESGESKTIPFEVAQSFAVATHEIDGQTYGPSPAGLLLRTLQLLRTIRREGYTPNGAGTIAISERIEELEEAIEGTSNRRPLDGMRTKGSG